MNNDMVGLQDQKCILSAWDSWGIGQHAFLHLYRYARSCRNRDSSAPYKFSHVSVGCPFSHTFHGRWHTHNQLLRSVQPPSPASSAFLNAVFPHSHAHALGDSARHTQHHKRYRATCRHEMSSCVLSGPSDPDRSCHRSSRQSHAAAPSVVRKTPLEVRHQQQEVHDKGDDVVAARGIGAGVPAFTSLGCARLSCNVILSRLSGRMECGLLRAVCLWMVVLRWHERVVLWRVPCHLW